MHRSDGFSGRVQLKRADSWLLARSLNVEYFPQRKSVFAPNERHPGYSLDVRTTTEVAGSTEVPIFRSLMSLAVPIVLANLLQSAYQLTDAFWVGRLGQDAVAAVSVSFPVTFFTIALTAGFAIAGSSLIAQYAGARNQRMVNHVAAQTLFLVVVLSIVLGAGGYLIAPALLHAMGVTQKVFAGAVSFLHISFLGMVFVFGFAMFQALMRGVGQATLPLAIVVGTVLLNFALDPLFIFGWGPVPGQGVAGAALATLSTQGLALLVGVGILVRGTYGIELSLVGFRPDFAFIKRAFLLGFPASIDMSSRALGVLVITFLIASFGTLTVAAYGVGSNILQLAVILAMGLSMATGALVGQNIGAENAERAERIARLSAKIAFGTLTGLGVLAFVLAPEVVAIFIPGDPAVIREGASFVRIMALTFGFVGVQFTVNGVFRASGNMFESMILGLVSQWVLQFPLAYVLSKHTPLGPDGLWWAFPITNVLMAALAVAWFAQGNWKARRLTGDGVTTRH